MKIKKVDDKEYYFNSKKQGELDFVIELNGKVTPLQIKSGKDYKRHSALNNVLEADDYGIQEAYIFSEGNVFFARPKYQEMQSAFPKVASGNSSFLQLFPAQVSRRRHVVADILWLSVTDM